MPRTRTFPFSPSSATQLEVGDLVGVRSESGKWGCLQVVDLEPGSRATLWAGLLDWSGDEPPDAENTAGAPVRDAPMTRIELFTHGGLQVLGNRAVRCDGASSSRTHGDVGTVHRVSGWKARIRAATERADGLGTGP